MRALFETDIDYKRFRGDERDAVKALYPSLYYVGQRSTIFTLRNYFIWVGSGFFTSFAFFMFVHYSCQFGIMNENGKNTDMWGASIILFTSIILTVNVRIIVTHRLINLINFISIFGLSILLFYLYHWISNYATFWTSKTYVTSEEIHKSPIYYLLIFGCTGTMFVIDLFVETIKVQLLDSPTNVRAQLNGSKGVTETIEGEFKEIRKKYEERFMKEDLLHEGKLKKRRDLRMKKMQERLDEEDRKAKEENIKIKNLRAAEIDNEEEMKVGEERE